MARSTRVGRPGALGGHACTGAELACEGGVTFPLVPPLGTLPDWSNASADGFSLWQPAMMLPSETSLLRQAREADGLSVSISINVSGCGYKSKLL